MGLPTYNAVKRKCLRVMKGGRKRGERKGRDSGTPHFETPSLALENRPLYYIN
jgi:hypothetical protein